LTIQIGKPISLELAGHQFITISGDYVVLVLHFHTKSGIVRSKERFFIFEQCGEHISLGLSTAKSLLGKPELAAVVFGPKESDTSAPEDLSFSPDVQLYPDPLRHDVKDIHVDTLFPQLDKLQSIIDQYAPILFAPFDSKGLSVPPMDIQLKEGCSLHMQPARFINKDLLPLVKAELDRLVDWGVLSPVDDAPMAFGHR
jgi:hypothetical protein